MPAQRLVSAVDIGLFDVVGIDSAAEPHFVRHLALSTLALPAHNPNSKITLAHMRPPLDLAEAEQGPIHTFGFLPLDDGEQAAVRLFADNLASEQTAYRLRTSTSKNFYCIRPHTRSVPVVGGDGTIQFREFSCVGFVIEAYEFAGIRLIATEEANLPPVTLTMLRAAYPDPEFDRALSNPRFRAISNLAGDGPWPIVLPGYVLSALSSVCFCRLDPRSELPYQPRPGDEYFPPRP